MWSGLSWRSCGHQSSGPRVHRMKWGVLACARGYASPSILWCTLVEHTHSESESAYTVDRTVLATFSSPSSSTIFLGMSNPGNKPMSASCERHYWHGIHTLVLKLNHEENCVLLIPALRRRDSKALVVKSSTPPSSWNPIILSTATPSLWAQTT